MGGGHDQPSFRVALYPRMTCSEESQPNLDERFDSAVGIIQNLPKEGPMQLTRDQKLKFYSFFKQATIGQCNKPKPSFWNIVDSYKWDAWNKLGEMQSEEAKLKYVECFRDFVTSIMGKYNFVPWLKANDEFCETVLRPKFYVLGYDWQLVEEDGEQRLLDMATGQNADDNNSDDNKNDENSSQNANSSSKIESVSEGIVGRGCDAAKISCSDDGYEDASDENEHFHLLPAANSSNRKEFGECHSETCSSSSSGSSSRNKDKQQTPTPSKDVSNSVRSLQHTINTTTRSQITAVTKHLQNLLRMLTSQQKILTSLVSNISPQTDGIFLSWRTLILLILWPVLVKLIVKFFKFWAKP